MYPPSYIIMHLLVASAFLPPNSPHIARCGIQLTIMQLSDGGLLEQEVEVYDIAQRNAVQCNLAASLRTALLGAWGWRTQHPCAETTIEYNTNK